LLTSPQNTIFLVEEQNNPSTEYFVTPALVANNHRVIKYNFSKLPNANDLVDSIVIFIRYLPTSWIKLIGENRHRLKALVFFMDDDVLDYHASSGMPWYYRFKLARLSARHVNWLRKQQAELWVSTPYLVQKYAAWQPKLILPFPSEQAVDYVRVFYHGSSSHRAEINWLRPVIENVLNRNDKIAFELIGGAYENRLYKGLGRVTVTHPMKWASYQSFVTTPGRHIGLAPLLNLPFNHARSYTKFFDIHRSGAVGIFSPNSACAEIVSHDVDGLIVELNQEAWAEAILKLANDEGLRLFLLNNAENKLTDLRQTAHRTYQGLFSE